MDKPTTGADVAHLADLTSTGKLLDYLAHDPNIVAMFSVDESLKLEDVAAVFINGDEEMGGDWYLSGMISDVLPSDRGLACMCIRVEPFYLYKLTGGRYE